MQYVDRWAAPRDVKAIACTPCWLLLLVAIARWVGDLVHFVKTLQGGVPLETGEPLELSDISLSARQADLADVGVLERSVRTLHGALVGGVSCRRSNVHISERVVSPRRAVVAHDILFLSVFGRCS